MKIKLFASAIMLAAPAFANAELVELDYLQAGDGLILFDDVSGYQWLDLNVTENMSFTDVANATQADGQFDGWSMAGQQEVDTFFTSMFPNTSQQAIGVNYNKISLFIIYFHVKFFVKIQGERFNSFFPMNHNILFLIKIM